MKKPKFYSMYNHPGVRIPAHDFGPSKTEPDESLTIQQILVRVQKGLTTGVGASTSEDDYDDPNDDDFDDPTLQPGFDKLDAALLANGADAQEKGEKIQKYQEDRKKKKKKKEFDQAVDAEIERRKQESKEEEAK